MNKINLKNEIHYLVDYRSPPSGFGALVVNSEEDRKEDSKTYLITSPEVGPEDMEKAKECIKPEYLPDRIIHIPINESFYELADQFLGAILVSKGVKYVVDSELSWEYPELTAGDSNAWIFTLKNWLKAREIKGIM